MTAVVAACTPTFEVNTSGVNAPPYASAGTGSTYSVGSLVQLDGTGSFDPDGDIRSFRWTAQSSPIGSAVTIAAPAEATTTLTLDVVGVYTMSLVVTDDRGLGGASAIQVIAKGPELVVNAGSDAAVSWKTVTQLTGTASVEQGFSITGVVWTIASGPGGGAVLTNATTLTPTFSCGVEGTYTVRLTASTAFNSESDDISIECSAPRQLLPSSLVDAEYSTALDRYVLVSGSPSKLHLHDPATGTAITVDLPYLPTAVSVSPDGLRAAVGHAGYVTTVNLQTMAVITTYTMTVNVGDIVYGADDRIHCFDRAGFSAYPIHTVNTTSGAITINQVWADGYTRARLHPGGTLIYSTRTGSPDDIESYDVAASPITSRGDSPYHGQYFMGGNLWFTADGTTIITASRNMFYSSTNPNVDMTFRAALSGDGQLMWVVDSALADRIAAVSFDYDMLGQPTQYYVQTYDDDTFAADTRVNIPPTRSGGLGIMTEGRWAAYRSDGSILYVIGRAMTGSATIYTLFPL